MMGGGGLFQLTVFGILIRMPSIKASGQRENNDKNAHNYRGHLSVRRI